MGKGRPLIISLHVETPPSWPMSFFSKFQMPSMWRCLWRHKPGSWELTVITKTGSCYSKKGPWICTTSIGKLVKNVASQAFLNLNPHFIRFPCTFRFNPLLKIARLKPGLSELSFMNYLAHTHSIKGKVVVFPKAVSVELLFVSIQKLPSLWALVLCSTGLNRSEEEMSPHCPEAFKGFCACMLSHFSRDQLYASLWTVAHRAPLSRELSRQEY